MGRKSPINSPISRKTLTLGCVSPVRKATAQIHTGASGLSLAAQAGIAKIRIPNIESTDHLHRVIADLQEVSEKYASQHDWFVNLSELHNIPISLAGTLHAYNNYLTERGYSITLEVEDLFHFRAALVAKLKKHFRIRKPQPTVVATLTRRMGT